MTPDSANDKAARYASSHIGFEAINGCAVLAKNQSVFVLQFNDRNNRVNVEFGDARIQGMTLDETYGVLQYWRRTHP